MTLKIEFFTIVYNGQPWIRWQADFFRALKGVDWRWHVVEGLAEHVKDTAWCKEAGGRISDFKNRNSNLSTDGTREFLDGLKQEFGDRVSLYRPPGAEPWPGKKAMIESFLPHMEDGCLLWQLDVDEFWRPEQVLGVAAEFAQRPDRTAAWFDCDYFFGWDRCSSRPGVFGNFRAFEWLRVWRYQKGDRWVSHEPPILQREMEGGRREDVGRIYPLSQQETRARGWKFQHYAMTDRRQVEFKEIYYGHRGLTAGLTQLETAGRHEPLARSLFPHIHDQELGTSRTLRTFWKKALGPLQPGARAEDARNGGVVPMAQVDIRGQARFSLKVPQAGQPASILVIRADRIGDQILFLPFLASLRKQLPFAQIHLAVPEDVAPIYRLWGEVDRLHAWERDPGHTDAGYRRCILETMPRKFDWVILPAFNGEKVSHKLAQGVQAARKVGFAGEFRGIKGRHQGKYIRTMAERVEVPNPDLHELEKYRVLLRHLRLKPEMDLPQIPRGQHGALQKPKAGTENPGIVLAVSTVNAIKEYPHWPAVVKSLHEKTSPRWVLIGGPGETFPPMLPEVLPREATRDLRGKTTLESLAGVITDSDLFLGVDTGPAHLALALGKPAVVVLGGGDYGRFFPYGQARVVTQRMDCFQCHWNCRYERARCLHEIPPHAVVREVLDALGRIV